MNKIISIWSIIFLCAVVMSAVFVLHGQEIIVENPEIQSAALAIPYNTNEIKSENSEITIFAVGDIMLDRGVEYMINKHGKEDFKFPFLKIADELKNADIVFGNLETVISDKGEKVGSIYSFRADPKVIQGLKFAGFDILSLANNHMLDYTREALEDTIARLNEAKIDYVGAGLNEKQAFSLKIKEIEDTKIGFLAYTNLGPESWKAGQDNVGMAWISGKDIGKIKKDIEKAKQKVDVLIVSMHSGEEYLPTITAFQEKFAKSCIDVGADIIIGHHPHIIQKIEKYKGKYIFYSLGNFIFDQGFSEATMEGLLLDIKIKDKKIDKIIPQKIKISNLFQPDFQKNYYLKDFAIQNKKQLLADNSDFVEVNLCEMEIKIYKQGILQKKIDILAKGDPEFWAGSAVGLYDVISRRKLAFSSTAEVYMPHSINFYGKYYIHGQPYYSIGNPTNFEYTGGCIRISNKDAEYLYNSTEKETPILMIDAEKQDYSEDNFSKLEIIPDISAKAYLVADLDTGFVFTEKIAKEKLPIASLTKLMTAIVVVENLDLRKDILIRKEMLNEYGSTQGLDAGKRFKVIELFHPLLIESSNDVAKVMSYFLGTIRTIELMNEKAKIIGMKNTNFVDASGFDPRNISTAQDLFYLAKYVFKTRPPFLKITKGEEVETFGEVGFENLENKNIFYDDANFIGGKTGYIKASQYTGIFLFRVAMQDNTEKNIAIIILGSDTQNNFENDVNKLLNWFKQNYSLY